ncbi:acyl carrier protein, partial [Streptomyces noursei]
MVAQAMGGLGWGQPGEMSDHLRVVYAEVLERPTHEIDDDVDFFELGGNSLLATRLVNRVRARFGVSVAMRDFFGAPSVAEFAEVVARAGSARGALVRHERPEMVPLSFGQR